MQQHFRIRVWGRVQGVAFRVSTKEWAEELGLAGWVQNESGGSMVVVAEGEAGALQEFVRRCRVGPTAAKVEAMELIQQPVEGLVGFVVR